jgi:D-psicose/D-tagatose/L-ribulose 3-epimerase
VSGWIPRTGVMSVMNKIGVVTWVWVAPLTTADLDWLIPHIKEIGADWVEIPIEEPRAFDYQHACRLLQENGLGVSVCAAMSPDRDLIHPNPVIRKNGAQYIRDCVDAAYSLGAHVVGGPLYSATGRVWKQTLGEREHDLEILRRHLVNLAAYASDHDVVLAIEAINRFETSFVNLTDQTIDIVERVNHPACQAMVDTFHMNIEETDIGNAIRRAGQHLVHVHACENDRGAPGSGQISWIDVATALNDINYQGACVIESFSSQVETIAKAASIWRPLATSQDELASKGIEFLRGLQESVCY